MKDKECIVLIYKLSRELEKMNIENVQTLRNIAIGMRLESKRTEQKTTA
jgi:hypothetical protein